MSVASRLREKERAAAALLNVPDWVKDQLSRQSRDEFGRLVMEGLEPLPKKKKKKPAEPEVKLSETPGYGGSDAGSAKG